MYSLSRWEKAGVRGLLEDFDSRQCSVHAPISIVDIPIPLRKPPDAWSKDRLGNYIYLC